MTVSVARRAAPPAWVDRFVGLPFSERGQGGLDCWDFAAKVRMEQFGLETPMYDDAYWQDGLKKGQTMRQHISEELALGGRIEDHLGTDGIRVDEAAVRPGDFVVLNYIGAPIHIGVVICPFLFVHCERGRNSDIGNWTDYPWRFRRPNGKLEDRVYGFFRYRLDP